MDKAKCNEAELSLVAEGKTIKNGKLSDNTLHFSCKYSKINNILVDS